MELFWYELNKECLKYIQTIGKSCRSLSLKISAGNDNKHFKQKCTAYNL